MGDSCRVVSEVGGRLGNRFRGVRRRGGVVVEVVRFGALYFPKRLHMGRRLAVQLSL